MDACPDNFGPELNNDVSGIGVRISFYLQALFLALLSARSGSLDEITGALYTLIATNLAMAVTSLILGFKPSPGMTFQDALVVFYLLSLSWAAVFFSLPSFNRFIKSDRMLKFLSILQSFMLFAFAFAVLITAKHFGKSPECNSKAVVVLFRPFSALNAGRIVGWIVVIIVVAVYSFLIIYDYLPVMTRWYEDHWKERRTTKSTGPRNSPEAELGAENRSGGEKKTGTVRGKEKTHRTRRSSRPIMQHSDQDDAAASGFDLGVSGNLIIEIVVILILWALTVMNTELMIRWNDFQSDDTPWQFGQILPLSLIVLPLVNMFKSYRHHGLGRRAHRTKIHKKGAGKGRHPHAHRHPGPPLPRPSPFAGSGAAGSTGGNEFKPWFLGPQFQESGSRGAMGSQFRGSDPRGGMPSARISAHSIHSVHSDDSGDSNNDDLYERSDSEGNEYPSNESRQQQKVQSSGEASSQV